MVEETYEEKLERSEKQRKYLASRFGFLPPFFKNKPTAYADMVDMAKDWGSEPLNYEPSPFMKKLMLDLRKRLDNDNTTRP